jgi:hypothetical protein
MDVTLSFDEERVTILFINRPSTHRNAPNELRDIKGSNQFTAQTFQTFPPPVQLLSFDSLVRDVVERHATK